MDDAKQISLHWIEFAIKCCEQYVAELEHEDIDSDTNSEISDEQWGLFLDEYDKMLYKSDGNANLPKSDPERLEVSLTSIINIRV